MMRCGRLHQFQLHTVRIELFSLQDPGNPWFRQKKLTKTYLEIEPNARKQMFLKQK